MVSITVIYLHGLKNQLATQNYLESQIGPFVTQNTSGQPEPENIMFYEYLDVKVEKHCLLTMEDQDLTFSKSQPTHTRTSPSPGLSKSSRSFGQRDIPFTSL